MKKAMCCILMACVFAFTGCSSSSDKKNSAQPVKQEEKEPGKKTETQLPKTYTYTGIITDATSENFTVQNGDQNMHFNREDMKITGADSLLLEEEVTVTYYAEDDHNVAVSCEIKKQPTKEEPAATEKKTIDSIIENMSIEEKVGQMFFVRCPEQEAAADVSSYHLGGYLLFDRDFKGKSYQQVVANIRSYQKKAEVPLLIGVDEEGGTVNRVSNYFRAVPFWSPRALYKEGGFSLIQSDTKEKAELLTGMGINVNFAPVADVSTNSQDFIYQRAFGKDAKQTATYVRTVVSAMKKYGIGSVMKHFPGYGNNVDTHTGIAIDKRPYKQFQTSDFLPFEAGMQAGGDSVLVAHNIVHCMDKKYPASLSKEVHRILRENLKFNGVIMTDDLAMDAIKQYSNDDSAAVAAIKAGNDMLICTNYRSQLPAVIKAVKNKEISEEQLNTSVRRILTWKQRLGLLK